MTTSEIQYKLTTTANELRQALNERRKFLQFNGGWFMI